MSGNDDKELFRSGIREAKAGNKEAARQCFERAAQNSQDPDLIANAWFAVSQLTEQEAEKWKALKNCLASDPKNARARQALAGLEEKLKAKKIVALKRLSPAPEDPPSEKADRMLCPKCGQRMSFTADGKSLICEPCTQKEKLTSRPGGASEADLVVAAAIRRVQSKPLDQPVFRCEDCSSQFILIPNQPSAICVHCGSARLVNRGLEQPLLAPDRIVPQAFTQKHATQLLIQWLKERRLKPDKQTGLPREVYLPLWTFNLGGVLNYIGEQTEVTNLAVAKYVKRTRMRGSYPVSINSLPIPALRTLAGLFQKLVASFDLKTAQPFDPSHLAHCPASVYDLPLAEASLKARAKAVSHYKHEMSDRIDMRILSTSSAQVTILSFHLDLLPAWMTELSLEGRKHLVLINGESGTIASDLPEKSGVMKFLSGLLD